MIVDVIINKMTCQRDQAQALHLMRFFKCKEGEYGYGDKFLGIRVPSVRNIVKEYRSQVAIEDVENLIKSPWHEIRLAGFLLLIELYNIAKKSQNPGEVESYVKFYLKSISYGNNWDLVDLVAPKILGDWLVANRNEISILTRLSAMTESLWHQRVAIVANLSLIKAGYFESTFAIVDEYLTHKHDLIHKASGWMLREVGKRGGKAELVSYLERNAAIMPRTMLRYSIEHFSATDRQYFLKMKSKV